MKSKKYLMIIVLVVAILLLGANSSHAVLQSNGTKNTTFYDWPDWMLRIRQMESLGGTLGLTETINTTTLLPTSESNNLDIHMEKNTEYGAIAILSASSYGNPNKINDGQTTTGNKTGIVMDVTNNYGLYTASVGDGKLYAREINTKYYNDYKNGKFKIGDAVRETNGWHGSVGGNNMLYSNYCYVRACRDALSIFSVNDTIINSGSTGYYTARAIMICGEGI